MSGQLPNRRRFARPALAAAVAALAVVAAAGCSTKAKDSNGGGNAPASGGAASVKTGPGITGTTIHLGVLTDTTGVFAATGKDLTLGQQVYWDQQNRSGGVCGKYKVALSVEDHGYNVQTATTKYAGMKDKVLALQQLLGSPMATALSPDITSDELVTIPLTWAQTISDNPNFAIVGATYDVEIINGLDYALSKGLIKKGDKLGHIFHESEYGANASAGVKSFARKNGLTVVDQKISATESDLSSRITALKTAGVNAIVLTTTPTQTAAAATASDAQGLKVPIIGSGPSYAPTLVATAAKSVLESRYYYSGPNAGLDTPEGKPALDAYKAKNPSGKPANSFVTGFATGQVMKAILEKACADGDLTRAGVVAAKKSLAEVKTGGLTGTLDYSKPGISPTRETFVAKADSSQPGGSKTVASLFEGPTAKGYVRTR